MDFEALADVLIPLAFLAVVGGLITLRMLKPYGDKILQLVREIQKDRHQALSETRDLQHLRDRLDMLAERQDFLESLVEHRLDESEQEELERIRRRGLTSGSPDRGTAEAVSGADRPSGAGEDAEPGTGEAADASGGETGSGAGSTG